jgi:hypothetical protein
MGFGVSAGEGGGLALGGTQRFFQQPPQTLVLRFQLFVLAPEPREFFGNVLSVRTARLSVNGIDATTIRPTRIKALNNYLFN